MLLAGWPLVHVPPTLVFCFTAMICWQGMSITYEADLREWGAISDGHYAHPKILWLAG
jgi:hypothetical protein